jgi:hypothetical protein
MLYVNDYPNCLQHSAAHMYADDTTQDVSDRSIDVIENKLLRDLENTLEWMDKNKLRINLKKTQCMLNGTERRLRKSRKLSLQAGDDIFIENVPYAKLLGVYIDRCLTWSEHIEILLKTGVFSRLRSIMSTELLIKIFNAIVFPHLNYCCTVWGNMKIKESLYKLCKLQKRQLE